MSTDMGLWGRLRGHSAMLVPDRPWNDPALDAALDAVPALLPEPALDHVLAYLRPLRPEAERHVQATEAFATALIGKLDGLSGTQPAADPATEADRLTLLGLTLTAFAWQVRGTGRGAAVSATAARRFLVMLEEADDTLGQALRLSPHHPAAATARLRTALGLGSDEDQWWQRFSDSRRVRGTLYPAHLSMLTALCRKWYGSDEQMFDFARSVTAAAPAGDPVVAMLPAAHAEYLLSARMFGSGRSGSSRSGSGQGDPAAVPEHDLDLVAEASARWCGAGVAPPEHARNVEAHQLFGWCLGSSQAHRDRARWHLGQAGPRLGSLPWDYLPPSPAEAFGAARSRLGVR
jgi:hypothetical protein